MRGEEKQSGEMASIFQEETVRWFTREIGRPTRVQEEAWPAILRGEHTLVSAPTGTGKTLSAFLGGIDRLFCLAQQGKLLPQLQLIYVSPLKSLATDIRENLRRPLAGIAAQYINRNAGKTELDKAMAGTVHEEEENAGFLFDEAIPIQVAVRTGDTTPAQRRQMIKHPPHILITTPESLYLLLTSASGRSILKTAQTVIVDELHALISSKRGAHLMLSLARLDELCAKPLQRIGLSATIQPLDRAAQYLSPEPVTIVAPPMEKRVEITVESPMTDATLRPSGTIWPDLGRAVYERCMGARSAIAFVEGRLSAEKLAHYVNEIAGEGFARAHHGSLSKERRAEVEQALRSGRLRLLCATSSMELGIDVGEIDCVLQVGCPRSVSSTLQRLGRAGHNPDRVSVMRIFPRTPAEGLSCGLTAQVARSGDVEPFHSPRLCLDVLAQHLVSMAATGRYSVDDVMRLMARAYPFYEVTRDEVCAVLRMLAGDFEHEREVPVRPRVLYDRMHDWVEGDAYSRMLAVSSGGTIPNRGMYTVRTGSGVKLGELDEEFVFESRVGDTFLLGTFAWKMERIDRDCVYVSPASGKGARVPFWKGDRFGRSLHTGLHFGKLMRKLSSAQAAGTLREALERFGLNEVAAEETGGFLERQVRATGVLPDDQTIVIEHFKDETGCFQMMVHSIFGGQVNAPLCLLLQEAAQRFYGLEVGGYDDDDGLLLFVNGKRELPEGMLHRVPPETVRPILEALLPATPLYNMVFRYNSARALMMGVRKAGRQPLWVQRLRGSELLDAVIDQEDHPLIWEARRECMEDYWDVPGVEAILRRIRAGEIRVVELMLDTPSPMALPLRRQAEAVLTYEYSPTTRKIQHVSEEAVKQLKLLRPGAQQLRKVSQRTRLPEDERQLHSLLMIEGDWMAGELDIPAQWMESLAGQGRVLYIEPGLWIAAEHADEYRAALEEQKEEAMLRVVRRALRYRGEQSAEQIAQRYGWSVEEAQKLLQKLVAQGNAVAGGNVFIHSELYGRANRMTVRDLRDQIRTLPPERYAALLAARLYVGGTEETQLRNALLSLQRLSYPPALWEGSLFPARVDAYRPDLLDKLLAEGEWFWQIGPDGLAFYPYEAIDWEGGRPEAADNLEGGEKAVYDALFQRGASFATGLSRLLDGASPHDALMSLVKWGLVHADRFVPVREMLEERKMQKSTVRQRIGARANTLSAGRWEAARPLLPRSLEQEVEDAFTRSVILCRETAGGLPWKDALTVLRRWELIGRVRRGYFIEGMSGAQFVRAQEFEETVAALMQPPEGIFWLTASDPSQPWGRSLPHRPERSFLCVNGTAVALKNGLPVAVLERQGSMLRMFDDGVLEEALSRFVKNFRRRRIFPTLDRVTVKKYPKEAGDALREAGFVRQMHDYVLYLED